MKVFVWSWRQSLLAVALAAVLSPAASETAWVAAAEEAATLTARLTGFRCHGRNLPSILAPNGIC